jgi:hypothetical protein
MSVVNSPKYGKELFGRGKLLVNIFAGVGMVNIE